ncbi:UNVERIFIED_CONTAM: Retrovirus-related Pol polyprotein from transposon TNT 1-94 [Sesamum calycinum]|uniref:Retrovirus-related Pol polyprotein from transposon TNT 1-94 n=1 Tax=Sesamum calycinum TaxID=2727403 RepID=A0AAW2KNY3_9LAMI
MNKAKPVSTPLANHFKLSIEQCPKTDREVEDIAKLPYASVVGCLMYAMVCTCPDLAHAVSQVYKYMSKPGRHHWDAIKWIFRYLKDTVGHGVVFSSQQNDPLVVGYVDSDYAGDLDDRMSTTGIDFSTGYGMESMAQNSQAAVFQRSHAMLWKFVGQQGVIKSNEEVIAETASPRTRQTFAQGNWIVEF